MTRIEKKQIILIKQFSELQTSQRYHIWRPPVDIFETEEEFIVQSEIAGMKSEDFTISYHKGTLSISGNRSRGIKGGSCHRMEIPFGEFISTVKLSQGINVRKIEAFYDNGYLTVVLPKKKATRVEITEE